jgi:pyrroloquinoline-quinone synthase
MHLFERLETVRERWNVLEHPFYRRWSAGELTQEELAFYAGEYRHAVVALADTVSRAARSADAEVRAELEEHAAEEASHIALWDDFTVAAGGRLDSRPTPETEECAAAWTAGGDLLESLVAMYAIESGQPAISQTKLEGLTQHYGFEDGPATEYFRLHSELDHEHAAHSRALIEERLDGADGDRLVAAAEVALRGNWTLLDGVERRFGHSS